MVYSARCGHTHDRLYDAVNCHDPRVQWLYRQPTELGDQYDLGRIGAVASHLTLRQSGTATGPDLELAEDRRRSTERERVATTFLLVEGNAWGVRFARLALGFAALYAAYAIAQAVRNFRGGL